MRVFITGTAGFIGYHLAGLLLAEGHDGMTDYYDVSLKQRRYTMLRQHVTFTATEALLEDEGNHSVSGSNQISSEPRCFRAAL